MEERQAALEEFGAACAAEQSAQDLWEISQSDEAFAELAVRKAKTREMLARFEAATQAIQGLGHTGRNLALTDI